MQLFSLIVLLAKFTDPIRDVTNIRHPDRGFRTQLGYYCVHIRSINFYSFSSFISETKTNIKTSERKVSGCYLLFIVYIHRSFHMHILAAAYLIILSFYNFRSPFTCLEFLLGFSSFFFANFAQ